MKLHEIYPERRTVTPTEIIQRARALWNAQSLDLESAIDLLAINRQMIIAFDLSKIDARALEASKLSKADEIRLLYTLALYVENSGYLRDLFRPELLSLIATRIKFDLPCDLLDDLNKITLTNVEQRATIEDLSKRNENQMKLLEYANAEHDHLLRSLEAMRAQSEAQEQIAGQLLDEAGRNRIDLEEQINHYRTLWIESSHLTTLAIDNGDYWLRECESKEKESAALIDKLKAQIATIESHYQTRCADLVARLNDKSKDDKINALKAELYDLLFAKQSSSEAAARSARAEQAEIARNVKEDGWQDHSGRARHEG